jgi:hypothetical protein
MSNMEQIAAPLHCYLVADARIAAAVDAIAAQRDQEICHE